MYGTVYTVAAAVGVGNVCDEIDGVAAAKRKTRNDSVLSQYINQILAMFLISFQQLNARTHTHTRTYILTSCSMEKLFYRAHPSAWTHAFYLRQEIIFYQQFVFINKFRIFR